MKEFINKIQQWDNLLAKVGNPTWEKHYKVCSIPQTVENQLKEFLAGYESSKVLVIRENLSLEQYRVLQSVLENDRISPTNRSRLALLYMKAAKKYFSGQLEVFEYLELEKQQKLAHAILIKRIKKFTKVSHH
ncbi:MAG: hypothetical protein Q4B28_03120 [bacterium]|nr:hypothetical protein [bacterium]